MTKTIFILGCSTMQIPALRLAQEMGWRVLAADGNPGAEGRSLCERFFPVDLRDKTGLIAVARLIRQEGGLDGVFTVGTDFSTAVAAVAEALELPGHSLEAAKRATDKILMRKKLKEAGLPMPRFVELGREDNPLLISQSLPGPWVIKPVDSMGARGVLRVDKVEDLPAAIRKAQEQSRSGRSLMETFIDGPEYSLDALVDEGQVIPCGIADRYILYPPCFIEVGHSIPSALSPQKKALIWDSFEAGIHALGLHSGAAKGDIKWSPEGPIIGEIAARLSGGYMSGWTYPYASGIQAIHGALRLAVGLKAAIPPASLSFVCAERALLGIDGTLRCLEGREEVLALPGIKDVFLRYKPGDKISFPRNNVEKIANVIAVGKNHAEAENRARRALRTLRFELDPQDIHTGYYLDEDSSFPPDCFALSAVPTDSFSPIKKSLEKLWHRFAPRPSHGCPLEKPAIPIPPELQELLKERTPSPATQKHPSSSIGSSEEESSYDLIGQSLVDALLVLVDEKRLSFCFTVSWMQADQVAADFWKALVRGGIPGARWYLEHRP